MRLIEYTFEKKNGELRILRGSSDFSSIKKNFPERWSEIQPSSSLDEHHIKNPNIIKVIEFPKLEWRSIRKDSILGQRQVKGFEPRFHFSDRDGYTRRTRSFNHKTNYIKKDGMPYHILMVLNKNETTGLTRYKIEEVLDTLLFLENKDLRVRGRSIRAISRALRLFKHNAFVLYDDKTKIYKITDKGRHLLEWCVK